MSEKNEGLKGELCKARHEIAQTTKEIQSMVEALEAAKAENSRLCKELDILRAEKLKVRDEMKEQSKKYCQQIKILEAESLRLNGLLTSTNQELEALRGEYEGYKLRAQSVLRTKQSQSKETGSSGRNIAEIEEELEHMRAHAGQLAEKLATSRCVY